MRFCYLNLRHLGAITVVAASSALIIGCSNKDKATTQVVAKVDGVEISIHQVNSILAKSGGIKPENLTAAKGEILSRLIEQQIAINEAVSRSLDRSPEVITAIENAKREILARSVLDQIASSQSAPTDEEARGYFTDHPELFSQRRIFNLQEIVLRKTIKDIPEVTARVNTAKNLEEVAAWLKERNIEFSVNGGARAAEQVPLEILPKLHQFKDGQIGLVEGNEAFFIFRVTASRLAPLDEAQAISRIKVFLINQRGAEAIKREKATLKEKAKVEYLGEFAGGESAIKAKAAAEAKMAADAAVQAQAKAQADADALAKLKSEEKAALQSELEAQSKARSEARAKSSQEQKPVDPSANVNLEKGIKGLK